MPEFSHLRKEMGTVIPDGGSTYENFSDMYTHIYEPMVEHGIASKCASKVKLDKAGEIMEFPDDAFGLPT
jgi:hypothetical protein